MLHAKHPSRQYAAGLLLLVLLGCSNGSAGAAPSTEGDVRLGPLEAELRDLVAAVTPLPPSATQAAESDWYARRKQTLERLRRGTPELGRLALETFGEKTDAIARVRIALLDVASHCAPGETRPLLEALVTTYGQDMAIRSKACELLGRTSPSAAIEILEPLILGSEPSRTYPPAESMVEAWIFAAEALGRDPAPVLAQVATDIRQTVAARHLAVRRLGSHASPIGRQALETVLVESLGNNYLRRLAAQALRDTLPRDELCPLIERVTLNETDVRMQEFLTDLWEVSCG